MGLPTGAQTVRRSAPRRRGIFQILAATRCFFFQFVCIFLQRAAKLLEHKHLLSCFGVTT